jgi:PRD1 phage membrane DNA delivery
MGNIGPGIITVIGAVVGLAVVAVLVAQKAQTPQVLQGAGTALSSVIAAAVAPVTGSSSTAFGSAPAVAGTTH